MADEAYRAVFLRVHPTGKMVLSLTTEADGNEARYAAAGRRRARRPAARRQGRPRRREPLRRRPRLQHEPVRRHRRRDRERDGEDPRQGAAARRRGARDAGRRACSWDDGAFVGERRRADDRRPRALRPRHRRAAARRRGRARRADRLPGRLMTALGPEQRHADGPHRPRPARPPRPATTSTLEVTRWEATLDRRRASTLTADARVAARALGGSGGMTPLGDDEKAGIAQTIDDEVLKGGTIAFRSSRVTPRDGGLDVEGELDLLGVRAPIAFALDARRRPPHRPRHGQADRLAHQARTRRCSGRSRSPTRSRSRSTPHLPKEPTMVELDHSLRDRQAHRLQLGRDPRPRARDPVRRGRQGDRARRAPSRPRPRSRSRWARCR